MVEKVPSFKGGGILWFTDLTTADPMYIFPVLTSLAFLLTVEVHDHLCQIYFKLAFFFSHLMCLVAM
jgi:membrane protein insertase Oxa1/YidC/SpoIIIJ